MDNSPERRKREEEGGVEEDGKYRKMEEVWGSDGIEGVRTKNNALRIRTVCAGELSGG
jgi:hypothetical protein